MTGSRSPLTAASSRPEEFRGRSTRVGRRPRLAVRSGCGWTWLSTPEYGRPPFPECEEPLSKVISLGACLLQRGLALKLLIEA